MREYLLKTEDGTYQYHNENHDVCPKYVEKIEIPEGAVKAYLNRAKTINFVNADDDFMNSATKGEWVDTYRGKHEDSGHVLVWSRPTQPEELPFIGNEVHEAVVSDFKIGDLHVNLNVNVDVDINSSPSKHNHYYIDVSDVEEVDFYEIALRYNVTDPCIQHILKKCLAVGNRGHKDFHTDLKDIHDTAVRALRIHAG